ncbi:MAG: 4Fe-4S dicluster domain-containing protein [Actinomycetota bacterium]|nr:4Fe-4S dicluster domain-containing protein [Actinomycetota bacterium]
MAKRPIIKIDKDKCTGCGACLNACAEGALALDDENKAYLVKEIYCDGLGACLDVCEAGALKVVEEEAPEYDAKASYEHVKDIRGEDAARLVHGFEEEIQKEKMACGCPGSHARAIERPAQKEGGAAPSLRAQSELSQWPIQLHLISPSAPYFNESDLLIAADCSAFSLGSFHSDLLRGKKLVIACPKLDETSGYVAKLSELIKSNTIYSLTVATMTVPCCSSLNRMALEAIKASGKEIAVKKVVIGLDGEITG